LDRAAVPSFDRPATYFCSREVRTASDLVLGVAMIAPVLILTEFRSDYRDLMGMYAETMLLAASLPQYGKSLGRFRPLAYNEAAPIEERMHEDITRSFFSGHTSVSTAAGVFVATVYDTYHPGSRTARALWVGGLGIGVATGMLRIFSGMHYPSDVAVGFIVGAAVGYAIPELHKRTVQSGIIGAGISPPLVTFRIPM
jgi:membrane-associated phospholipid phosphatase